MMWVGTPAYFAVVLLRTIWTGAIDDDQGKVIVPPTPHVIAKLEPNLAQCDRDGKQWYIDTFNAAMKGPKQIEKIELNEIAWTCTVVATGGLEA